MEKEEGRRKWIKALWIAAIGLGAFILLIILLRLTLGVNFLLGEEIVIILTPEQPSLHIHYGETQNASIGLLVQTPPFCKASCTYTFRDKGKSSILDAGNLTLDAGQSAQKSYALMPSRVGKGQDIYSFDVACQNIRTFFCPSAGKQSFRSSLIIVNYDLSEQEKAIKEESKGIMLPILAKLESLDIAIKVQSERLRLLSSAKVDDLQERKAAIEGEFSVLLLHVESLRALWGKEAYRDLRSQLNGSLNETVTELELNVTTLASGIDGRIMLHNTYSARLHEAAMKVNGAGEIYALAILGADLQAKAMVDKAAKDLNATIARFLTSDFEGYGSIEDALGNFTLFDSVIEGKTMDLRVRKRAQAEFLLARERDYECLLRNGEYACFINETIPSVFEDYLEEGRKRWNETSLVMDSCASFQIMQQDHSNLRNATKTRLEEEEVTFQETASFNETVLNWSLALQGILFARYNASLGESNDSSFKGIINAMLQASASVQGSGQTGPIGDYLLLHLNLSQESKMYVDAACPLPSQYPYHIAADNLSPIMEKEIIVESSIDTALSDNAPVCCIFGECAPCCTDAACASNEETYPVVFLHGHAFTAQSTPSYSLDAFNLIQYALEDEGYLNAGIVTPTTSSKDAVAGEWGLSGKPISVKASYYLDSYREGKDYIIVPTKSENIDTYALRLKDIIETVKERTGKDKVNIVAHSMGGLVARRYIQVFGDGEVNKLIMIAVPNHGVEGKARDYCPLFGEQKECQDMQAASLFLNRLNDPSKQPKKVEMYTIAGVGCGPGKNQGDGIISAQSAHLEGALQYNITGSCGGIFGEQLHTEILDVEKYPRVLGIIKQILHG